MKVWKTLPILAALVAGLLTSAVAPAQADGPSCYGNSCTDLDPAQTNCVDDATTIWSVNATTDGQDPQSEGYGVLEMRYSPACHSNWVRFTNWAGLDHTIAMFLSGDQVSGRPWIWRDDVPNTPRGGVGSSAPDVFSTEMSKWTSMITADGTTCMSVDLYAYGDPTEMGGGYGEDELGNYTAGCIS
jgi:hypothetical protein